MKLAVAIKVVGADLEVVAWIEAAEAEMSNGDLVVDTVDKDRPRHSMLTM